MVRYTQDLNISYVWTQWGGCLTVILLEVQTGMVYVYYIQLFLYV